MINYVVEDRSVGKDNEIESEERDSGHQSVTVWVDREDDEREKRKKVEIKWVYRTDWLEEAREKFGRRTEMMKVGGEGKIDEKLEKIIERINWEVGKKKKKIGVVWKGGW